MLAHLHQANAAIGTIVALLNKMNENQQHIIHTEAVVNARAKLRRALNEGSNADTIQQLLRLLQERDHFAIPVKNTRSTIWSPILRAFRGNEYSSQMF